MNLNELYAVIDQVTVQEILKQYSVEEDDLKKNFLEALVEYKLDGREDLKSGFE